MQKKYLEIAKAVTVHGVRGELKLYPWCDSPEALCAQKTLFLDKDGAQSVSVESARPHKGMCLVKLEGVDTVERARAYIDRVFWADREDIPRAEGDYFVSDLVGARVFTEAGEEVGEVADVTDTGAQRLLCVSTASSERLVPFVAAFIRSVDVGAGRIVISPIKGLLKDED